MFQKKNETFKLASKELNVEDPVSVIIFQKRIVCIYLFRKFGKTINRPS